MVCKGLAEVCYIFATLEDDVLKAPFYRVFLSTNSFKSHLQHHKKVMFEDLNSYMTLLFSYDIVL